MLEGSGNAVPANCLVPAIAANFHHHVSLYKKVSEKKCKAAAIADDYKSSEKISVIFVPSEALKQRDSPRSNSTQCVRTTAEAVLTSKCNSLHHHQALGSLHSSHGDTITTAHTPICINPRPTVYLTRYLWPPK